MKKRNTVLLLGIFSIIILIAAQVIIIRGVLRQKDELFNLRYRILSQDAISEMSRRGLSDGFDTIRFLIEINSKKAAEQITAIKNDSLLAEKKKDIITYVNLAMKQEYLSQFLSNFFEKRGIEKNFNSKIIINNFDIISNDSLIPIYSSDEYTNHLNHRSSRTGSKPPSARKLRFQQTSEIFVKGERYESNFYRLDFSYFIDFSDKQKQVLRESAGSLALSIFSIFLVVWLFIVSYKNLMEEKRLSNLKTDFINNMTHELKTPLATITVAGKTLEMPLIRSNDGKILETAKLIGKQSVHLNKLINMILEISMWERTQFQLDKKTYHIENIMNDIVESFKAGCNNSVTLTYKYDFKGINADLDIVYFTTLINNLLSNAVKYSDRDPVIDIQGFAENGFVNIKVSDNGIGISKVDQKHIFDKFYRASTGNIHKYKGLGLGLYYVKRIAEAHGGDVTVSSKPGKGSIFTVTIPY